MTSKEIEKIKVWRVLQSMDEDMRSRLLLFLQSSYFNTSERLHTLCAVLLDFDKRGRIPTKQEVWDSIGVGRKFNDVLFRKYCSNLLKLVQDFLAIDAFKQRPLAQSAYRLNHVAEYQLDDLYGVVLKDANKKSMQQLERGVDFFLDSYLIERYKQMIAENSDRTNAFEVDQIMESLDRFYIAQRLTFYLKFMSQKRVVQRDYNLYFIDEILGHLERHPSRTPQISILYLMAKIYRTNDSQYFDKLQSLLVLHLDLFPKREANEIIRVAINFLIGWANEGKPGFLRKLFELHVYALDQPFFYTDGYLNRWVFMNIVHVALKVEEYDWCEHFIDKYADKLAADDRENAVRYNTARLKLYQHKYDKVISLLNQVEFEDMSYNLGSKSMLLATYYESGMIDLLLSFLDSFSVFLRRHKDEIPERRRKSFQRWISLTRKLVRIVEGDDTKLDAYEKEVREDKELGDRNWLLQMIERKRSKRSSVVSGTE